MKKLILHGVLLTVMVLSVLPVSADPITDAKNQKIIIDDQVDNVRKQQQAETNKITAKEEEKKKVLSAEKSQGQEYQNAVGEIKRLNDEIKTIDDGITQAEQNYKKQQDLLKTRLRVMYENSGSTYLETLIQSQSLSDFLERMELISLISKKDKEIVELLDTAKKDIEYKKEEKENQKADIQKKASEKQQALSELRVSRADLDTEIQKLKTKLDQLESEEEALLRKSDELAGYITSMAKKGTTYAGGTMTWPCPSSGKVTSPFGSRLHPILKKYTMHTGIDVSASWGQSIVAANSGTVLSAGWQSGYGYTVIIDHGGGITTLYAHSSRLLVNAGQAVKAGDTIAKIGSTGLSTGAHLHFEVRKNGVPVNPMDYVSP